MNSLIRLLIIALCLLCLADMPYGFFQFVRFVVAGGFMFLAFDSSKSENKNQVIAYIALAVLFQPLLKISLGRTLWTIVDVGVAIWLIITLVNRRK